MSVEMKDSGIAWLGKIPKHWNRISLKFLCQISTGDKDTVNKIDDGLYPFFVRSPQIERINSYTYDGEAILMAGDGVGAGRVFHYFCGKFDFHQRVYNLHNIQGAKGKFLYYYLSSNFYKLMDAGSAKSTVDSVRLPMLKDFPVVVPAIEEQSRIANFLDKKCAEIDELIALQEQMIAQLNTYKQAVITETVTKGLNPNVKMKDSGVEWIGKIPERWEVRRIKYIGKAENGLTYVPSDVCDASKGILVLRSSNIQNGKLSFEDNVYVYDAPKSLQVKKGDIIICSRNGSASLVGKSALVIDDNLYATFGAFMMRFRSEMDSVYTNYLLTAAISQYKQLFSTTTVNQLTIGIFGNLAMPFVNNEKEQQSIATYLDQKCKEIDELIFVKKEKIEKLKAYKKSVIYEYVTGKKQV